MSAAARGGQSLPTMARSLRHHWVFVLLLTLLGLGAAATYAVSVSPSYTSKTVLLVSPAPGNPLTPEAASGGGTQLTVAMETEAGIVRTPEIAQVASADLGRLLPDDGEQLGVEVPEGTQLVEITFTSSSPERATSGAEAFGEAFLTYREDRAESGQEARLEELRAQAETTDENLRRASGEAEGDFGSYAVQEVQLYTDRLAQLNESISATEAVSTQPGRTITPAEDPGGPNELSMPVLMVAGGVLGLLAGFAVAFYREWRRDLVREHDDVDVYGVPVFARLPESRVGFVISEASEQVAHEAYRRLRAGVVANGPRPHVLAVSAVDAGEHASAITSNLAAVLAEARFSVLVISADPEDRGVERLLSVPSTPGLAEVVRDGVPVRDVLVTSAGVTVMAGGQNPLAVRELYGGPAFHRVVAALRQDYDYIVLGSAATGTGDGDAVISAADSVLLALTASKTTHSQVGAAIDRFERLGISTLGAVITPSNSLAPAQHRQDEASATDSSAPSSASQHDVDAFT